MFKALLDLRGSIILFILLAISCAIATILESIYGSDFAWKYVYATNWFGLIMLLLTLNLIRNLVVYKMYKIKNFASFIFHISFIFIFLGAFITRYFGFEGEMRIREGGYSNEIITKTNIVKLSQDKKEIDKDEEINSDSNFNLDLDVDKKIAKLKFDKFIPNSELSWVSVKNGIPIVSFLFSDDKNKKDIDLISGEEVHLGDIGFSFNYNTLASKFIKILLKNNEFFMNTNQEVTQMIPGSDKKVILPRNEDVKIDNLAVYNINGLNFAPIKLLSSGQRLPVYSKLSPKKAAIFELSYNKETKKVYAFFGANPLAFDVGGKQFKVSWAPKVVKLPFSIYLKKFILSRYPGSNSPSGYASSVVVKDKDKTMDYKIYMNHVLDFGGYRFFQSSYDIDEKGTILSVNKDPGKIPTYIGYFLLSIGLILNIFNKHSRFRTILKLLNNTNALILVAFLSLFGSSLRADDQNVSKTHADKFLDVVVQGFDGRMIPFDTIARELMDKIHGSESFNGLSATQTILSIMSDPKQWRSEKFIKVSDKKLKEILGIKGSFASFDDFYGIKDNKSYYKLAKLSDEINRIPPNSRSTFDKDVLKVDERLNIFYMVFMGEVFRIIPKKDDTTWYSPVRAIMQFPKEESSRVSKILQNYFFSLNQAKKTNDYKKADEALSKLKAYQESVGSKLMPSANKLELEIFFNKAKIFQRLILVYLACGVLLFSLCFIKILRPNKNFFFINLLTNIIFIAFLIQTTGLGLRWYISGHAPWANAYESLVYISWAMVLSGLIFVTKSRISLSLGVILAGITLFVAHLNSIDPQITNIQPVLKSYWLSIHVSIITASYGFLGLCFLLGAFSLLLFAIGDKNGIKKQISISTKVNELSMILGLSLLTIGNFLGGVWANESWGRYWGWDPKETWALITILVYASIVHFRYIKSLNDEFIFSLASMFAFLSVIMTYFGVNFYLSGMHSYASGARVPVPISLWISLILMIILSVLAYKNKNISKTL